MPNAKLILDICEQAVVLGTDERRAFLNEACAGDEPLRLAVESLLQAVEDSGSFMKATESNYMTLKFRKPH